MALSPEVQEFFQDVKEGLYREGDLARMLKAHIMTDAQKDLLKKMDWSVEEVLSGRNAYPPQMIVTEIAACDEEIDRMFQEWNSVIGIPNLFGY